VCVSLLMNVRNQFAISALLTIEREPEYGIKVVSMGFLQAYLAI